MTVAVGDARWDTRIEILNLDEGRVDASVLRSEMFGGMADQELLYSLASTDEGLVVVDLWQIVWPRGA